MIIYRDLFTGDEMFSDMVKVELLDDLIYKVKGTMRTDTDNIDDSLIGGNASAEGGGEALESTAKQGVDIVLNGRLVEFQMKKKAYVAHIKEYMKRVKSKLEEIKPDEVEVFMTKSQAFVKKILEEFDEYQFFCGESMGPEGMLCLMRWEGETPYMYFFKHGLDAEKV